jgi:hypothetical protein
MEYEVQSLSPEKCKQILNAGLKACDRLQKKRAEEERAKEKRAEEKDAKEKRAKEEPAKEKRAKEKRAETVTLHDLDRIHEMLVSAGLERMKKK